MTEFIAKTNGRFMVMGKDNMRLILRHLQPYRSWPGIWAQTAFEGLCAKLSQADAAVLNTDELQMILLRMDHLAGESLDERVALARLRQEIIVHIWDAEKARIMSEARITR